MELFPLIFYLFLSFENESKVYDTDFTLVPIQKSFFQAFHNWFNLDIFGLLWWGPFSGGVLSPAVYRPSRLFLKHFGTVYKFINCTPKILIFDPSTTTLTQKWHFYHILKILAQQTPAGHYIKIYQNQNAFELQTWFCQNHGDF